MKTSNVLGWLGVSAIIIAYSLNMFGVVSSSYYLYGWLNIVGALGIVISSATKKDWQPVVINTIWLLIAFIGVIQIATS